MVSRNDCKASESERKLRQCQDIPKEAGEELTKSREHICVLSAELDGKNHNIHLVCFLAFRFTFIEFLLADIPSCSKGQSGGRRENAQAGGCHN